MKNSYVTNSGLEKLVQSPIAEKILELDLSRNYTSINNDTMQILSVSPHLKNLKALNLSDTDVDDKGLKILMES